VTTTSGAAAAPAQFTRVVVVEPKKGGRLAMKGFLTAFILAIIFTATLKGEKSLQDTGMLVALELAQPISLSTYESGRGTTKLFMVRALRGLSRLCS
jgi:hypothetical protein